ncbi:MAG TPA: hypothetical protein VMH40_15910 [Myxococcaceae bacterium]|nr:hypothetical protein [Myxococcaceae bacterium]
MSDRFDDRWERLAAAARRGPGAPLPPAPPAWVERIARRGLRARSPSPVRISERLAWAGLAAFATAAAVALLVLPGPLASTATSVASGVEGLPRALPQAPRLPRAPAVPRPALPSREDTLVALSRFPGLTLDFPFTSRRTERP